MGLAGVAARLSGRPAERAALLQVVSSSLGGRPQAVVVHGEAGVGKTTLVRSVVEELRADGVQVLWGQGLRFGAVEAMYHPLVLALEGWLAEGDEGRRTALVEAVPSASLILPSLGAPPAQASSGLVTVVDALLGRAFAGGPSVLVVDDVHWADSATRDALSYLVAGFAHQQVALVTTHRDDSVQSDEFHRWLANLRRLPGTQEQVVVRLDLAGTADQVSLLLGEPAPPRLVEQVYDRSRGNPYFSELLVRRGDLGSAELPADLPDELSEALLDAWRGLSSTGRELTRILAVGGRPTEPSVLVSLAAGLGVSDPRALREAIDAGVVVLVREGAWFRHPLLADVLLDSFLPGEAGAVHAAWAGHLEQLTTGGVDQLRLVGDLATHHVQAGAAPAAFVALLLGADIAAELGAFKESADLLTRAADLWDVGAPDRDDDVARARLLERAGRACWLVEQVHDAVRLLEHASALVDPATEPLWACRIALVRRDLAWSLGEVDDFTGGDIEAIVEVSRADKNSREHAEALAALARSLHEGGRTDEARPVAEEALAAAHRSRSAAALAAAYDARSLIGLETDLEQARRDAAACWEHALASGEPVVIYGAFIMRLWVEDAQGDLAGSLAIMVEMYDWSRPLGAAAMLPISMMVSSHAHGGRLLDAKQVLRGGLATSGNPSYDAGIRLWAAVLAVRTGADAAARDHLARARELMPSLEDRPLMMAGPRLAELQLAWGDPEGALAVIERVLPVNAMDPRALDELMVWGARAIGDLVERARDNRDEADRRLHLESLDRLASARVELPGVAFQRRGERDTFQPATAALYAAERGRAEGSADQAGRWREAMTACAAAGMGWERQRAAWRLAAALVSAGQSRAEAADLLRSVHRFACEQEALPLKSSVEELAGMARISLAEPRRPGAGQAPAAFAGLTARETEVLGHLVANRTYAEIGAALFISEKTVSVHVSNLLRKTDTASRREVAALARRVGWGVS